MAQICSNEKLPIRSKNSSSSSTSSESSTSSAAPSKNKNSFISFLKVNTLGNISYSIIAFILQIYIIFERFSLLKTLNSLSLSDTLLYSFSYITNVPSKQFQNSIIINGFLVTFGLIFAIIALLLGIFKLTIYTHDSFILGGNFDKTKARKDCFNTEKIASISLVSSGSSGSDIISDGSTQNSKSKLTKKNKPVTKCCVLKRPKFWSELPPVGVAVNLLAALFLLISEVQLDSKRIQIGQKPIGDIFSTKLDFLFGEPISRLEQLNLNKIKLPINSTESLSDIIKSKDDFSVFVSQTNNFQRNISLIYLNFLLSLIFFSIKISQVFWLTSKKFTIALFAYMMNISVLMALSFASYEILFKANNLKKLSSHFILSSYRDKAIRSTDIKTSSPINFEENFHHDIFLTFIYLFSSVLLFASGFLNAKFGFKNFETARTRFESNIGKYLSNSFLKQYGIGIASSINTSSTDCGISTVSPKEIRLLGVSRDSKDTDIEKNTSGTAESPLKSSKLVYLKRCFQFTSLYLEQLISSFLFLIYTSMRIFFIYEIFVVYKFTNDFIFGICIAFELVTILVWVLVIILFTIKNEWKFKMDPSYKLNYWNWLYINYFHEQQNQDGQRTFISKNYCHFSENKSVLVMNQQLKNTSDDENLSEKPKNNWETVKETENTVAETSQQQTINTAKTNTVGLLVRDDSLVLNGSSNMSSSSITEVSSLMPSNSVQFVMPQNGQGSARKNSGTILDASQFLQTDEEFNRLKSIRNSARLLTDELDYNYLFNNNQQNAQNTQENMMQISAHRRSYRPANSLKTNLITSSLRSPFGNSTIGEIMERRNVLNTIGNSKVNDGLKTSVPNESATSQTTTDSGRDSLDSPGSKGNKLLSAKPFLIEANSSKNGNKAKMTKNHSLDTNC